MRDPGEWGGGSQTHTMFYSPDLGSPIKARTYSLTESLIDRVDRLALREEVGQSDLVRFLLAYALHAAESGELEIPTMTRPGKYIKARY